MYRLRLDEGAQIDLEALWTAEPDAAALVTTFLEEARNDQNTLDSLTDHHFGKDRTELYHVNKWLEFWRKGIDLWRVKLWNLENLGLQYRIIYCYEPLARRYTVLGIVHRSFNYDPSHPISKRIFDAYHDLQ